jgi:uncharacterized membrane protein (UPF0127 family)
MRLPGLFVAAMVVSACSRVPDEPSPIVKPTNETAVKTPVTAQPTTTVFPESPKTCPADPSPAMNSKLYGHGTASFVTPDGKTHTFKVEIAKTDDAQERGLMYRTELAEDAGMVFDFAAVHHATFWMHNTCIALDMVFVSEDNLVIGVVTAPPLNDEGRSVPGLSKYVVELAAGVAKKRGIAIGTKFVPPAGS